MPLDNFARSLRNALRRVESGSDTAHSSSSTTEQSRVGSSLAGMPSNLHIVQSDIERLQRAVFRPGDTISGVVRAQGVGTLGGSTGYSFVEATLSLWIRLVKTTREEYYYGGSASRLSSFGMEKEYYDEDEFEETVYEIEQQPLYDLARDGARKAKMVDLLFEFTVPKKAKGQLLPPTLGDFV